MNYTDAVNYYMSAPKFLEVLGNDGLLKLLDFLGNPQDKIPCIHVAGTNGKGSVCMMIAKTLEVAGKKVGLFTSPFITVFNERIRINGENIADRDLVRHTVTIKEAVDTLGIELSSFAKITALAFLYFYEQGCDIVVLETGLGGRLDATNVVKKPLVSVITKIAFDHTEYLGETLSQIAAEKCGIIKQGCPVVTLKNQETEALSVIEEFAVKNQSELLLSGETCDFELGLCGDFQKQNAALAEAALAELGVAENVIRQGFKESRWPARFEFIGENLLIDGAHNPDGVSALLASLKTLGRPVHFVTAMMKDKNFEKSAKLIDSFGGKITVTQIDMPRCLKAAEFKNYFSSPVCEPDPVKAVRDALKTAESGEIVCVLGSLYLAGEIRKEFTNA